MRVILFAALAALAACATGPQGEPTMRDMDIVARNDATALVRLRGGQDYGDIARVFLGDAGEAWQLREINAAGRDRAGALVAVPLRPVNATSVYPDGYRTLPILCYHQFTNEDTAAHELELTAAAFEQQLRYLLDNDYVLLSFAHVEDILAQRRPIPEKSAVITIDDGYRSVYDVAWPILKKYRVPATLFIYTDFIGAPAAMSWDQLREMADSGFIEVESHGKSHSSLSRLPEDSSGQAYTARVASEIAGSNAIFDARLGAAPRYLSYPYGNSSDTASQVARQEGLRLAATVTRGDNTVYADPYLLHRTMIYDRHDMAAFRKLLRVYREKQLR